MSSSYGLVNLAFLAVAIALLHDGGGGGDGIFCLAAPRPFGGFGGYSSPFGSSSIFGGQSWSSPGFFGFPTYRRGLGSRSTAQTKTNRGGVARFRLGAGNARNWMFNNEQNTGDTSSSMFGSGAQGTVSNGFSHRFNSGNRMDGESFGQFTALGSGSGSSSGSGSDSGNGRFRQNGIARSSGFGSFRTALVGHHKLESGRMSSRTWDNLFRDRNGFRSSTGCSFEMDGVGGDVVCGVGASGQV